jgi:DNA-binding CsgD family transcriptional regulator
MRLLERQAQLEALRAALERARRGRGSTVLVSGEAGIGKTWLLSAFAAEAAEGGEGGEGGGGAPGARVFQGSCEDLSTPRSLGPFRDMARDAGGALALAGTDRDALIDLLLQEMRTPAPPTPASRTPARPVVVIVEDAHWADNASLDIVRYLARRVERLPAMLIVSYRDEELTEGHPLRAIIGGFAGPSVLRLELRGLSDAAVAELAAEAGFEPGPVVATVGGNPAIAAGDGQAVARHATAAAGEAARAEAHREAAAFARLALEHRAAAAGALDRLEVARLHGVAASALHARNRFGEAAEHADRAVEIWDASGSAPHELGEALLISARMSTLVADPGAARVKALRALEVLEPLGPSRALALCYSTLGAQHAVSAGFEAAASWAERALDLALTVGATDVAAHALCYRGVAQVSLGRHGGFDDLRQSVEIAERIDHGDYLSIAAHNLAVLLIRSGRPVEAEPWLAIGGRAAREHGLDHALFRIEAQQCHVAMLRGAWAEAERGLRRLLEQGDDPRANLVNPLAFLGRILARRGDPEAGPLVERAWGLAAATGEDQKMAIAAGARIEATWLAGDQAAVRAIGAELLAVATRARHALLRGEVLRYLRRAGQAVEPFPGCPPPLAAGIADDWEKAAALWEEAGSPYEQALELTESPDLEVVGRGLRILDDLGAVATAGLVRRRLRRRGVSGVPRGPRASTRANPGRLTDRQLDVLALLAEGATNAEIAERLYLSRRTVDNHVAALLTRLGVGSRHEAVAAAAALGLLPAADASPAKPR